MAYAPGSDINCLGTGNTSAYQAQLIGWNVEVGGTADAGVVFDNKKQYSRSSSLELYK